MSPHTLKLELASMLEDLGMGTGLTLGRKVAPVEGAGLLKLVQGEGGRSLCG